MKTKRFIVGLLALVGFVPLTSLADEYLSYTDQATNVKYMYNSEGDDAYVSNGRSATGAVTILSKFTVSGKEYVVNRIDNWCFRGNSKITSVFIPSTVISIGGYSFWECSNLESVNISLGVETIGECAFSDCKKLSSITIPSSVTTIENSAFKGCESLESVYSCIQDPFEIDDNVFGKWNSNTGKVEFGTSATLYVPKGTKSKYLKVAAWNKFKKIEEFDEVPTSIDNARNEVFAIESDWYSISGQSLNNPKRGINIVRMTDGTTRKVIVR